MTSNILALLTIGALAVGLYWQIHRRRQKQVQTHHVDEIIRPHQVEIVEQHYRPESRDWIARLRPKRPDEAGEFGEPIAPPAGLPNPPKKPVTRKIQVTALFLLLSFGATFLAPAGTAHAVSYYRDECAPQYFSKWNVHSELLRLRSNYIQGKTPVFIYKQATTADNRNVFMTIVGKTPTSRFNIDFEESTLKARLLTNDGFYSFSATYDEPKGAAYGFDSFWNQQPDSYRMSIDGQTMNTFNGTSSYAPDLSNAKCYVTLEGNVGYTQAWKNRDYAEFPTDLEYSDSDESLSGCGTLDIPCWFGYFFKPKASDMQDSFDYLNDFMATKLGFLTYPFDFLGDFFGAFTSGSSWCTVSSCTKNFGSFYGGNFSVDLNETAQSMPTFWTWFTGLVRGLTILALVLAIRRKYLGVIHK